MGIDWNVAKQAMAAVSSELWKTDTYGPPWSSIEPVGLPSSGVVAVRYPDGSSIRSTLQVKDAAEAWEIFATRGLIPMEWVDNPRRCFTCDCDDGWRSDPFVQVDVPCRKCSSRGSFFTSPHPASVVRAIELASQVPSMLAAEQAAVEMATALGAKIPPMVAWRSMTQTEIDKEFTFELDVLAKRWAPEPTMRIWDLGFVLGEIDLLSIELVVPTAA